MPKKKKLEEPAPEPEPVQDLPEPTFEEPEPEPAPEAAPKPEPLLTVRVTENFKDGALAARFAALGYPLLWKAGETRQIPMNLFIRCKRSGARFEL